MYMQIISIDTFSLKDQSNNYKADFNYNEFYTWKTINESVFLLFCLLSMLINTVAWPLSQDINTYKLSKEGELSLFTYKQSSIHNALSFVIHIQI